MRNLILVTAICLSPMTFNSCATPGDPTPAVVTVDSAKQDALELVNNFKAVITSSTLSETDKAALLATIDLKFNSLSEKLDLVTKYLMSVAAIDYSMVAKDVALRIKALYEQFKASN